MKLKERISSFITWLRPNLPAALLGVILGAVVSFWISYYFWRLPPTSLEDLTLNALTHLHNGQYNAASDEFAKALVIAPANASLWEGKAYSHLGLHYGSDFSMEYFWSNFDLEHGVLSGELSRAFACAQNSLFNAQTDHERIKANLLMGLVLELTGYDDFGAVRHGLAPMQYYAEAARFSAALDRNLKAPRSVEPIRSIPYHEVVDYAVQHRLMEQYQLEERQRVIDSYFQSDDELRERFTSQIAKSQKDVAH